MPMDGLTLGALARELQNTLYGGRIDRIQQTERDELLLTVRAQGKNHKLLLSSSANHARLHLTSQSKKSPDSPPMFCMLLRKNLLNGKILGIGQIGHDRIIEILVESLDDFGDLTTKRIIIEIMGRHSNLMLVSAQNRIIDCARHITGDISRVREVLPGLSYETPPAQDKLDPCAVQYDELIAALSPRVGQRLDKALQQMLMGFSAQAAREMSFRICGAEDEELTVALLPRAAETIVRFFVSTHDAPTLFVDEDGTPVDFTAFPYLSREAAHQISCETLSAAVDAYYTQRDHKERLSQKSHNLKKHLQNTLERNEKKLAIQREALLNAENMDDLRKNGDLLTSCMHLIARGAPVAQVPDYFHEDMPTISIQLNPALSPAQNAQRYYKLYNKAKTAAERAIDQMDGIEEEITYLEGQLDNLTKCTADEELEEIRIELVRQGLVRDISKSKKPPKIPESKPYRFLSSTGVEIFVGKNNLQNDRLTASALGDEIWLHTKDMPGSHVIIKSGTPDDLTLEQAAQLAAYFSRGRLAGKVPVDYTQRKHVKKPSGSRPGFVIYTNQQTLYVIPEEKLVKQILAQA